VLSDRLREDEPVDAADLAAQWGISMKEVDALVSRAGACRSCADSADCYLHAQLSTILRQYASHNTGAVHSY
jgi:hypothetical protein